MLIQLQHGLICLATGANATDPRTSEDCLFLDVYAPTNASNLPVFFFIQGGGFNQNSNSNYNGSQLIEASGFNIVIVNFNYRVGPYGFLASEEVLAGGSINNGLKDQRKALEWVQRYISKVCLSLSNRACLEESTQHCLPFVFQTCTG